MAPRSLEQYRRLQIGGIGLAAVILLVVLAGILSDRNIVPGTAENGTAVTETTGKAPSEPLSELGVQPAPAADNKAVTSEHIPVPTQPNARQVTGNGALPDIRPGERVPDLPAASVPQQSPAQ